MSQILNKSPFCDEVLNLTNPQIDFIFEMYAKDHPEEVKFNKHTEEKKAQLKIGTAWDNVLEGREHERFARDGYVQYILNASRRVTREVKNRFRGR